ncbi:MAG: hypothetical protein LPK16_13470 [Rhodobacterales bacterium]|jgi:hypothetical protein|nr:hypothetical protein [Rhodobacterales bacterium]MDX5391355.1 hypothetical protein [Rhodobacterales bacterium]
MVLILLPAARARNEARAEANISETIRKDWAEAPEQVKRFWAVRSAPPQGFGIIPYHDALARGAL